MAYCYKKSDNEYLIPTTPQYNVWCNTHDELLDNSLDLIINSNTKDYLSIKGIFFEVITYLSKDFVEFLLQDLSWKDYIFILHDCDIDLNGELKKPHIHLLLHYKNPVTLGSIAFYFHTTQVQKININNKPLCRYKVRYLTHKDDLKKFQYSEDLLVYNCLTFWESLVQCLDGRNIGLEIIEDLLSGFNESYMLKKYGREYIINHSRYNSFKSLYLSELDKEKNQKEIKKL